MFETGSGLNTYYPLEFCLVVDSRLATRKEIVTRVRGSALFRIIYEPESITAAIDVLENQELDVCIIGPSLSLECVALLLDKASKLKRPVPIAFVAFGRINPAEEATLKSMGVKQIFPRKCSPRIFYEGLARAVLVSNYGESDERVRNFEENSPFALRIEKHKVDPKEKNVERVMVVDCVDDKDSIRAKLMFGHVLDKNRQPGSDKVEAIEKLKRFVQDLVEKHRGSKLFEEFLAHFNCAYGQWFEDAFLYDPEEANRRFREKVLEFGSPARTIERPQQCQVAL